LPSDENATALAATPVPSSLRSTFPVLASIATAAFPCGVAITVPSGENTSER
jgi:hypothetical protein